MTLDIDRAYPAPELAVGIDRALLDGAGVSGTMPQATSATPTAEGVVYLLALGPSDVARSSSTSSRRGPACCTGTSPSPDGGSSCPNSCGRKPWAS